MSAKQRCVHRSKTCCQTLKHFDNVISTCRENVQISDGCFDVSPFLNRTPFISCGKSRCPLLLFINVCQLKIARYLFLCACICNILFVILYKLMYEVDKNCVLFINDSINQSINQSVVFSHIFIHSFDKSII